MLKKIAQQFGTLALVCGGVSSVMAASPVNPPSATVAKYIKVPGDDEVLLQDVVIIDGTGAKALAHQDILLAGGKIAAMGATGTLPSGLGRKVLPLAGHTVFPGLVGMHNHLFYIAVPNNGIDRSYENPILVPQMTFSAPRLYLAGGVTTMRTTGSVEPFADLNLKRGIDDNRYPGPHLDVTAPYLESDGSVGRSIQMTRLRNAEDAREAVRYWAAQGATSFKAYNHITREQLSAAAAEAHKLGLKITGHLCSVTYPEAAAAGIDNLEHGFFVNTQLETGKLPDQCPDSEGNETLSRMKAGSPAAAELMQLLVKNNVAITSTLPVFESDLPQRRKLTPRVLEVLSPPAREALLTNEASRLSRFVADSEKSRQARANYANELALEREFVAAGGLLMTGPDPTGGGDVIPGFGDQRGLELLVDAGFSPEEAIRIGSYNGARYLGRDGTIGSVAVGKNADLVVVRGDPSKRISDIENVEIVFKDGVGFDPAKLIDSVKGRYGQY